MYCQAAAVSAPISTLANIIMLPICKSGPMMTQWSINRLRTNVTEQRKEERVLQTQTLFNRNV